MARSGYKQLEIGGEEQMTGYGVFVHWAWIIQWVLFGDKLENKKPRHLLEGEKGRRENGTTALLWHHSKKVALWINVSLERHNNAFTNLID